MDADIANKQQTDWEMYDKLNGVDTSSDKDNSLDDLDILEEEGIVGFDDKTIAQTLGLSDIYSEQEDFAIVRGAFDDELYKDVVDSSDRLQQLSAQGKKVMDGYDTLQEDSFLALYKHKPKLNPEGKLTASGQVNSKLLKNIVKTDTFKNLRKLCRNNILNSAVGTQTVAEKTTELFIRWKEELEEARRQGKNTSNMPGQMIEDMNNIQAQQNANQQLAQQAINAQQASQQQAQSGNTQQAQQLAQQARQLAQQAQQAQQQINQQAQQVNTQPINDPSSELNNGLMDIYKSALLETTETDEMISNWGLDGATSDTRITLDSKRSAINRLRNSRKLKHYAQAIGKMKSIANNTIKRKTDDIPVEIEDIETGDDLRSLLPKEYVSLAKKELKRDFYKKYNEKGLSQYHKKSADSIGKGPMIICLDESGSMGGDNEMWSKAITVALMEVAQKQKRNFNCVKFAYNNGKTFTIKKGELDPNDMLDLVEEFMNGGGTEFEPPLRYALKKIEESDFKKADIVFITDGQACMSDSFIEMFNKTKEKKDFSVVSMLLDAGHNSDETLKLFSDKIVKLGDISEMDNASQEVLKHIIDN